MIIAKKNFLLSVFAFFNFVFSSKNRNSAEKTIEVLPKILVRNTILLIAYSGGKGKTDEITSEINKLSKDFSSQNTFPKPKNFFYKIKYSKYRNIKKLREKILKFDNKELNTNKKIISWYKDLLKSIYKLPECFKIDFSVFEKLNSSYKDSKTLLSACLLCNLTNFYNADDNKSKSNANAKIKKLKQENSNNNKKLMKIICSYYHMSYNNKKLISENSKLVSRRIKRNKRKIKIYKIFKNLTIHLNKKYRSEDIIFFKFKNILELYYTPEENNFLNNLSVNLKLEILKEIFPEINNIFNEENNFLKSFLTNKPIELKKLNNETDSVENPKKIEN